MCVFPDLFRGFKQPIVGAVIVVFAVVGGVGTTNLRAVVIIPAAIVGKNVFAVAIHHQEPDIFIDENGTVPMHDVPTHVIVIFPGRWCFDGQGKVATASRRAVTA